MKPWYEDRIRLTWGSAFEAFYMSVGGVLIAGAIVAAIIWLTNP